MNVFIALKGTHFCFLFDNYRVPIFDYVPCHCKLSCCMKVDNRATLITTDFGQQLHLAADKPCPDMGATLCMGHKHAISVK